MKGTLKAMKRAPHMLTSKVGMASKSSDVETEDLKRRFAVVEEETAKLLKDAKAYREGVYNMLLSSTNFATAMTGLFTPMGSEHDLASRFPQSTTTIESIEMYQSVVSELRDTIQPELDLIDSRIIAPVKEYSEVLKKVSKMITKRDHKLVDFDRHNNSYTKLRDKRDKTLKDEQNIFKVEQDYELAMQDYEHHNNLLKLEMPRFFELTTAFISPLFHSFYYMQLNVMYITLEKLQAFAGSRFDMSQTDLETVYRAKLGSTGEDIANLSITRRFVSTAKLMSDLRQNSNTGESYGSAGYSSSGSSAPSLAPKPSLMAKPPLGPKPSLAPKPSVSSKPSFGMGPSTSAAPPPPYTPSASGASAASSVVGKRAPPPPPAAKPKPQVPAPVYVTALYDFAAQAEGDLSFSAGDKIELVKKAQTAEDWWTGRLNGQEGVFPGNYVQE